MSLAFLLKIVGLLISGFSGLLGTIGETHETIELPPRKAGQPIRKQRRLNRTGKISIGLIVFGLLVALISQTYEQAESGRQAAKTELQASNLLDKAQSTLATVRRVAGRIQNLRFSAELNVPLTNAVFDQDLNWLSTVPREGMRAGQELPGFPGVLASGVIGINGRLVKVVVTSSSPRHPANGGMPVLANYLERQRFLLSFYRSPNFNASAPSASGAWLPQVVGTNAADLVLLTQAEIGELNVRIDRRECAVSLDQPARSSPVFQNGRVYSVHDLAGCELDIRLTWKRFSDAPYSDFEPSAEEEVILDRFTVRPRLIRVDGFSLQLVTYSSTNYPTSTGGHMYCYRIPPDAFHFGE